MTDERPAPGRVRGRRPPQGDPVVDRAFALLGRLRRRPPVADAWRAEPAQRHPGQLRAAAGRPADGVGRPRARHRRPLHRSGCGCGRSPRWRRAGRGSTGGAAVHGRPGGGHPPARAARRPRGRARRCWSSGCPRTARGRALPGRRPAAAALDRGRPGAARLRRVRFQEEVLAQPLMHLPEKVPVSPAALRRTLAEIRREGLATIRRRAPAAAGHAWPRRSSAPRTRSSPRCRSSSRRRTPSRGCSARPSARRPARSPADSAPAGRSGTPDAA